ncbi:MAG: CARDB domain-containing protein [Chloroflexota bacterium]
MKKLPGLLVLAIIALAFAGCQTTSPAQADPTAYIDSITPSTPTADETISFQGHGTDPDGEVVVYRWTSSIDGDLNTEANFDAALSPGNHTIRLVVQDNNGNWSPEASTTITVSAADESEPEEEEPEPEPVEAPVISSFTASPDSIVVGDSSELAWDVSGADSVSIDNGVGEVAASGTATVSPGADTTYTLTVENEGGSVSASTLVVVTETATEEEDLPDLIVTSITRDESTVKYTIKNQGTADAAPSNSRLFVDGSEVATDGVNTLAAGASRTESFSSYTYACSGSSDNLLVQVDKDGLVDESNESNNTSAATWTCFIFKPIIPDLTLLQPDLTITSVWESGDKIYYRVKNEGTMASAECTAQLYIMGDLVATDASVPSIAAGASLDRKFAHNFSCIFSMLLPVEVRIDTEDTNTELNEDNNSMGKSLLCN